MSSTLRALSALVITGLLLASSLATASAQEPVEEPTGLSALCVANAPDEGTLATCLDIVRNVLEPADAVAAGSEIALSEPLALQDLLYGAEESIGYISFWFGEWAAMDDKGKRPKVGSKKWRALATSTADELGAFLLTVEPGPCTEDVLLDMWAVYGAFKRAGAGAKAGDRLISGALTELFSAMAPKPDCGPGWVVQEERG